MKSGIHPKYNSAVQVVCACGATFTTRSTKDFIKTEICSKCHPFYTGQQKFVDTVGKIDRFQAKMALASQKQAVIAEKKKEKKERTENAPRTLREMLMATKG
jgi:large subunit ribosomal protein L31